MEMAVGSSVQKDGREASGREASAHQVRIRG
jgi:hypothetical protein